MMTSVVFFFLVSSTSTLSPCTLSVSCRVLSLISFDGDVRCREVLKGVVKHDLKPAKNIVVENGKVGEAFLFACTCGRFHP